MNLLFIYGPPATGKLTIATKLSELTGYPLFHNHLSRDLVHSIYSDPAALDEHYGLVDAIRLDVFEHCAVHNTNLIFTYVYDGPTDEAAVADMVHTVKKHGGKVLFIELEAPKAVLLERVANDSRKQHKKLTSPAVLNTLLETVPYPSVPYPDILKLDSSEMTPTEAAKTIISHYQLS